MNAHADRTLILLRHGKSAYPTDVADHDRPLAPRGERQAALAGAWIGQHLPPVDLILCSTAERTRQTLERTGIVAPTSYLEVIYGADRPRTVLVVGHAPGLPYLAMDLAGSGSDLAAVDRLRTGFPTSAVAVLSITGTWSEVEHGRGALLDLVVPR
jgi:phosphohistidine phosphatase